MKIKYVLYGKLTDDVIAGIPGILAACDDEFVPPLSERYVACGDSAPSLRGYIENIICSCDLFAIAIDDETDKIIGFASAQTEHVDIEMFGDVETTYISTICIFRKYRSHGIANELYRMIETYAEENGNGIVTLRTWSTNETQIALTQHRGYQVHRIIENDRGDDISSVYFLKHV